MDLIILNDGLYQLIPVTKQIMEGIVITAEINCFDFSKSKRNFSNKVTQPLFDVPLTYVSCVDAVKGQLISK